MFVVCLPLASLRSGLLTCAHTSLPVTSSSHCKESLIAAFLSYIRNVTMPCNHVDVVDYLYYTPFINFELINKKLLHLQGIHFRRELVPGYLILVRHLHSTGIPPIGIHRGKESVCCDGRPPIDWCMVKAHGQLSKRDGPGICDNGTHVLGHGLIYRLLVALSLFSSRLMPFYH